MAFFFFCMFTSRKCSGYCFHFVSLCVCLCVCVFYKAYFSKNSKKAALSTLAGVDMKSVHLSSK